MHDTVLGDGFDVGVGAKSFKSGFVKVTGNTIDDFIPLMGDTSEA